jgi:hypothetical protein
MQWFISNKMSFLRAHLPCRKTSMKTITTIQGPGILGPPRRAAIPLGMQKKRDGG